VFIYGINFIHDFVPVPQFFYVPVHDFVLVLWVILSYNICALYRYQMIFVFRTGIAFLYQESHVSVPVPLHYFFMTLYWYRNFLMYRYRVLYRYQMIFVFRTGIAFLYQENWCYLWFFFFILAVCKHSNVFIELYLNKSCIRTSTITLFFYDSVLVSQFFNVPVPCFVPVLFYFLYRYYMSFVLCTGTGWYLCSVLISHFCTGKTIC